MQKKSWTYPLLLLACYSIAFASSVFAQSSTQTSSISTATPKRIIIPNETGQGLSAANFYPENLLRLALDKTSDTDGKAYLEYINEPFGRERLRSLLREGNGIDVLWSSSTPERDKDLLPVKFNIMKGLNEYRVLLIREEDIEKFSKIKTLDDLRHYRAGSGTHWSDTLILKSNNLPYTTSWAYEPLFKMLAAKRFDYMARGMQEVKHELIENANLRLTIADKVMLHYHQPVYFYVSRKNPALADRILRGLELAQTDGTFDQLFYSISEHRDATEEIKNNTRVIFNLDPPT